MKDLTVIYIMWLRDMKRFVRSPSRIIGNLVIPLLLLVSLGFGFGKMAIPGFSASTTYMGFLVPGMAGIDDHVYRHVLGAVGPLGQAIRFPEGNNGGPRFESVHSHRKNSKRRYDRGSAVVPAHIDIAPDRL